MIKNITLSELATIVWEQKGRDILVKTGTNGFTFKTFAKVENVNEWTEEIEIELDNQSTLELTESSIQYIRHDMEISRNNTNKIQIKLNNDQLISFEYEVIEGGK